MGPFLEVKRLTTREPEQTQELGRSIGGLAQPGDVFLLTGDLGAGKTCLTQGIAWGLDVEGYAMSPSFVLVREYSGRLPLYHMDFYRIEKVEEVADLGLDDYFCGRGVCVVEWADRAMALVPREHLLIEILIAEEKARVFTLTGRGQRYVRLLHQMDTAGYRD